MFIFLSFDLFNDANCGSTSEEMTIKCSLILFESADWTHRLKLLTQQLQKISLILKVTTKDAQDAQKQETELTHNQQNKGITRKCESRVTIQTITIFIFYFSNWFDVFNTALNWLLTGATLRSCRSWSPVTGLLRRDPKEIHNPCLPLADAQLSTRRRNPNKSYLELIPS